MKETKTAITRVFNKSTTRHKKNKQVLSFLLILTDSYLTRHTLMLAMSLQFAYEVFPTVQRVFNISNLKFKVGITSIKSRVSTS
jgi:hypothetical protein